MAASAAEQIRISGRPGSAWLYSSVEPSSREACSPAATRDRDRRGRVPLVLAAGVHVGVDVAADHRGRPWRRPSPSAPARRRARSASRPATNAGGAGPADRDADRPPGSAGRAAGGGSAVLRTRALGRAARPRRRSASPRSHSATCTAQSVRPASPNSRVPSSGSTIQTRSGATAGPGRRGPPRTGPRRPGGAPASWAAEELVRRPVTRLAQRGRRSHTRRPQGEQQAAGLAGQLAGQAVIVGGHRAGAPSIGGVEPHRLVGAGPRMTADQVFHRICRSRASDQFST